MTRDGEVRRYWLRTMTERQYGMLDGRHEMRGRTTKEEATRMASSTMQTSVGRYKKIVDHLHTSGLCELCGEETTWYETVDHEMSTVDGENGETNDGWTTRNETRKYDEVGSYNVYYSRYITSQHFNNKKKSCQ